MVYEFRDITKLPASLNRTCIFILLVTVLSSRVSLCHAICYLVPGSQAAHSLCCPRFGAHSALDFFFNFLAFPGGRPSPPC